MYKKILILLMVFTLSSIFGQMNNYEMELVHTFVAGDYSPQYIEPLAGAHDMNPSAFFFDNTEQVYVADSTFRRIVKYDKDFNFIEDYKKMESSRYSRIVVKDQLVYAADLDALMIETLKGEKIFSISRSKTFNNEAFNKFFSYIDDVVTISTMYGSVYKIENPSSDPNSNTVVKVQGSYENRKLNKNINNSDNDLFANFKEFRAKVDKHESETSRSVTSIAKSLISINLWSPETMMFLGSDNDGNIYWNDSYINIIIFNSNYEFIDAFSFDVPNAQIDPVIHPTGDVYFMDINNERAELLRVKRVW